MISQNHLIIIQIQIKRFLNNVIYINIFVKCNKIIKVKNAQKKRKNNVAEVPVKKTKKSHLKENNNS